MNNYRSETENVPLENANLRSCFPPRPNLKHLQIENYNMIISFRYKIKFLGVTGKKKAGISCSICKGQWISDWIISHWLPRYCYARISVIFLYVWQHAHFLTSGL